MYTFIRTVSPRKALLQNNKKEFFIASFSDVPRTGPEVLVFPANQSGEITDSLEVDGGSGYQSLEDFLSQKVTG